MTSNDKMATGRSPKFKLVLLGEVGVGKSTLFFRLKDNVFHVHIKPTTRIDRCSKSVRVGDVGVTFDVWDTAGVERYKSITKNHYRQVHIAALMYSLDDPKSLHSLAHWMGDTEEYAPDAVKVLIGNKSDLPIEVAEENVKKLASKYNVEMTFWLSAKTGDGVEEAFTNIAETMLEKLRKEAKKSFGEQGMELTDEKKKQSKKSGCGCRPT